MRLLILIFSFIFILACKKDKNSDSPNASSKPMPSALKLEGYIAQKSLSNKDLNLTGTILTTEQVELKAETSGKIEKINFKQGGQVAKGQVLVKLDDSELDAEIQKLLVDKKLLKIKEDRQKQLLDVDAGTKADYDIAMNALESIDAQIKLLQVRKAKSIITAPFSGIIGFKEVSEGAYITPTNIVATLYATSPLEIEFSIPEKYTEYVKKGTKITFTLVGSSKIHNATIHLTEPFIDPINRTLRCRALYNSADKTVLPGAFANIEIAIGRNEKTISVPAKAIIPDINGAKVYVKKDGKAKFTQVTLGMRSENNVEIISGLNEGDTIITNGILQLKPGNAVEISELLQTAENL